MSLVLALALLTSGADALEASARRVDRVLPGVGAHVIAREEARGWLSEAPFAGRLVMPAAVFHAAQDDAERDALLILTVAYAPAPARPAMSPLAAFLANVVSGTVDQKVLERRLATPTDNPPVPERPLAVGSVPVRLGPPPGERSIALATRLGIGVCPMARVLNRLGAAGSDGRLTAIALDARRVRRDLGLAAYGC
jgi:hypothetical protein